MLETLVVLAVARMTRSVDHTYDIEPGNGERRRFYGVVLSVLSLQRYRWKIRVRLRNLNLLFLHYEQYRNPPTWLILLLKQTCSVQSFQDITHPPNGKGQMVQILQSFVDHLPPCGKRVVMKFVVSNGDDKLHGRADSVTDLQSLLSLVRVHWGLTIRPRNAGDGLSVGALQILDIVTIRHEVGIGYIEIQSKCYDIVETSAATRMTA
ncbi:hypothetical protein GB937_003249 [Aspergillus fischeri]|nr:hypothetical protein GB937_003249 [Aspergillus fischeri]